MQDLIPVPNRCPGCAGVIPAELLLHQRTCPNCRTPIATTFAATSIPQLAQSVGNG